MKLWTVGIDLKDLPNFWAQAREQDDFAKAIRRLEGQWLKERGLVMLMYDAPCARWLCVPRNAYGRRLLWVICNWLWWRYGYALRWCRRHGHLDCPENTMMSWRQLRIRRIA